MFNYYPNIPAPYEYTQRLNKCGIDVNVICLNDGSEVAEENIYGVEVARISLYRGRHFSHSHILRALRAIRSKLRGNKYDVIHVYEFRGCGLLPLLAPWATDSWLLDVRTGSVNTNPLISSLSNILTRLESYAYKNLVAIDSEVGRMVYGKQRKFHVLPLGADFEMFNPNYNSSLPEELGLSEKNKIIMFVSNLSPARKPERVLKAFAKLLPSHPSSFLVMIGGGSSMPELQLLSEELSLKKNILFTGSISRSDVSRYLAVADVGLAYVPATKQFQNQPPLKTVEYMASGVATVATDTSGNRIFIEHGINGLLSGDSEKELASAMNTLLDDDGVRCRLAKESRPSVQEFDWNNIVNHVLMPIYKKITYK